jgi:NAD(P)-dependent dehydrogenase (short-subunit alcohol dehydrogenase family)
VSEANGVAPRTRGRDSDVTRLTSLPYTPGVRKKIALVTGASRGIGRAISLSLAGPFDVVVNYARRADGASEIPRPSAARGGRVVNVSSGAARTGRHRRPLRSQAGMLALTAKAARELAGNRIAVDAVLPSMIETDVMHALARDDAARARLRAQFPIGRFGQPEERP